jgi:hypothetical protein
LIFILGFSLPLSLLLIAMLRRGFSLRPKLTAVIGGLAQSAQTPQSAQTTQSAQNATPHAREKNQTDPEPARLRAYARA